MDANEALDDANTSKDEGPSALSPEFQSIDNTNIALSDIEKHERATGISRPANSAGGQLNRATTVQDIPRSSARYALRSKTGKSQKIGHADC